MVRTVKRRVWHRMKDARNVPKEGGYGGGGPSQSLKKGIKNAAGTRPGGVLDIDPLVYVGGAWPSCPACALCNIAGQSAPSWEKPKSPCVCLPCRPMGVPPSWLPP